MQAELLCPDSYVEPLEAHVAPNKGRHACERRRAGEAAVSSCAGRVLVRRCPARTKREDFFNVMLVNGDEPVRNRVLRQLSRRPHAELPHNASFMKFDGFDRHV